MPGDPDYRAYNGLPLKPTGGLRCIRCGLCADNCPAGAIPKAAPQKVDKHKCISCLRCIQICPQSARGVPLPLPAGRGRHGEKILRRAQGAEILPVTENTAPEAIASGAALCYRASASSAVSSPAKKASYGQP